MDVLSVNHTEPNNHQPVLVKMDISTLMKLVNVIFVLQNVKLVQMIVADVALVLKVEETTHHTVLVQVTKSKLTEFVSIVTTDVKLVEKETQDTVFIVLLTENQNHGLVHVTMVTMKNKMKNVIHVTIPVLPVPLIWDVQLVLVSELLEKTVIVYAHMVNMKILMVFVNLVLQNVKLVSLILITVLNVLNKELPVLNLIVHV